MSTPGVVFNATGEANILVRLGADRARHRQLEGRRMSITPYEVSAFNRRLKVVLFVTGEVIPFASLIDSDGEMTDDMDEAVAGVVEDPAGKWHSLNFADFETVSSN